MGKAIFCVTVDRPEQEGGVLVFGRSIMLLGPRLDGRDVAANSDGKADAVFVLTLEGVALLSGAPELHAVVKVPILVLNVCFWDVVCSPQRSQNRVSGIDLSERRISVRHVPP